MSLLKFSGMRTPILHVHEVQNLNEIGLNEIDASLNEINIFTQ